MLTRPKLFLDLVGMGDHSHSAIHPAAHQMASAGSLAEEQQVPVQAPLAHSPMLKYFASSPLLVQRKLSTKRPASNGSIGTEISGWVLMTERLSSSRSRLQILSVLVVL